MSEINDLLAGRRKVEVDQIESALDGIWRETNVNTLSVAAYPVRAMP